MSALILPSRFRQQPQAFVGLSDPYSDAIYAWNAATPKINVATRETVTVNTNSQTKILNSGYYNVANDQRTASSNINIATLNPFAKNYPGVAILGVIGTPEPQIGNLTYIGLASCLVSNAYYGGWQVRWERSGGASNLAFIAGDANVEIGVSFGTFDPTELVTFIATRNVSGVAAIYAKGSKTGYKEATTSSMNAAWVNSTALVNVNGFYQGSQENNNYAAPHYLSAAFPRNISKAEALSLIENPWQIYRAPDRRIWVGASVGGGDTYSLTGTGIATTTPSVGTPALTQNHVVTASAVSASAALGTPALTQNHVVTASAIATAPATLGTTALTQNHVLTATGISSSSATLGTPMILGDAYSLTASAISATPTVGTPAITQNHALTATAINATPTLGTPLLSGDTYPLTATAISVAPTVGSPAMTQNHVIAAGAIAAGPVTFGTPTLSHQHVLLASGVAAGYPVLGTPALSSSPPGTGTLSDEDIVRIVAAVWGSPLAPTANSIADAVWSKVLP